MNANALRQAGVYCERCGGSKFTYEKGEWNCVQCGDNRMPKIKARLFRDYSKSYNQSFRRVGTCPEHKSKSSSFVCQTAQGWVFRCHYINHTFLNAPAEGNPERWSDYIKENQERYAKAQRRAFD